jgi:predicted phosphoribosyltransferase
MTAYGRFQNRAEAGRALAKVLVDKSLPHPVVLAPPRGGVPVAAEVARTLQAPLDVDFHQVPNEEVVQLLAASHERRQPGEAASGPGKPPKAASRS